MGVKKMNVSSTYMLEKTKVRKNIDESVDDLTTELFSQCYSLLDYLEDLKAVAYTADELQMSIMEYLDEQMGVFDAFSGISINILQEFNLSLGAGSMSYQHTLERIVQNLEYLIQYTDTKAANCVIMTGEEVPEINEIVTQTLGLLTMFMFNQFNLADTVNALETSDKHVPLNIDVHKYCDVNGEDPADVIDRIMRTFEENRPKIAVFENNPGLLAAFEDTVGPLMCDFVDYGENLTLRMVTDIIAGKLDPSKAIEELM